jgi:hypothetical protein
MRLPDALWKRTLSAPSVRGAGGIAAGDAPAIMQAAAADRTAAMTIARAAWERLREGVLTRFFRDDVDSRDDTVLFYQHEMQPFRLHSIVYVISGSAMDSGCCLSSEDLIPFPNAPRTHVQAFFHNSCPGNSS